MSQVSRRISIPMGTYYIGRDIPSGTYLFTYEKERCLIFIENTPEDFPKSGNSFILTEEKRQCRLQLPEGAVLVLKDPCSIERAPMLLF